MQYKHRESDTELLLAELLVQQLTSQRSRLPVPLFDMHHSRFPMLLDTRRKRNPSELAGRARLELLSQLLPEPGPDGCPGTRTRPPSPRGKQDREGKVLRFGVDKQTVERAEM